MKEVISAKYIDEYNLWIEFNDGTKGIADLKDTLWGNIFEPLKDKKFFMDFRICDESIQLNGKMELIWHRNIYMIK